MKLLSETRLSHLALTTAAALMLTACGPREKSAPEPSGPSTSTMPSGSIGTADEPDGIATVEISGVFTYKEQMALPEDSYALIQVSEFGGDYTDGEPVADQLLNLGGLSVPISYEMTVPKGLFEPDLRYALRVDIYLSKGEYKERIWATERMYPIDPSYSELEMPEIVLVRVATDK